VYFEKMDTRETGSVSIALARSASRAARARKDGQRAKAGADALK